ncbi:MAG: TonB-dependent receptor [Pseudomonadota bacterium]|nr:TonB-dependent receptor [Pseudomonadota bacterium]
MAAAADDASPATTTLERIVVTGSHLPRVDGETALPVQIIRREAIERSGASSVEELLQRVSANLNSSVVAVGQNNEHPNYSGVSLRGFGSHATLVLLNGRRLANHAFSDESGIGVDLNTIPVAAIERIEVLKDGASAIYGSDAIAGVVNFILRNDFRGVDAGAEQLRTQQGGGGRRHETLTIGAGNGGSDGYNAFVVIDHQQQHALNAVARSYAATAYRPELGINSLSVNSFPANIATPRGFVNPAAPACTGLTVAIGSSCRYDFVRQTDLLPPDDNVGLLARATLNVGSEAHAYVELVGSRHRTTFATAPSPANSSSLPGNQPLVVPVGSPFYPTGLGLTGDIVDPAYRTVPAGPRVQAAISDQGRLLVGWQGTWRGWATDTALAQSTSRASYRYVSGIIDGNKLAAAFATGLINPFGDSGAAGDVLLRSTQIFGEARRANGTTRTADLRLSRDVAEWAGRQVTVGLGIEARSEALEDRTTEAGFAALGGQYSDAKSGSRRAQAAFAEVSLPIVSLLDAQLAFRGDRYSDFGTSFNPKAGLRWQPLPGLVFRGSLGTGFRAPSLPELYTTQVRAVGVPIGLPDPQRCPVTGLDSDCDLEVDFLRGGNPSLQPERSRQTSLGFVFEPAKGISIGIDWWRLKLEHTIGELFDEVVLNGDPHFEGKNIVRGPVDPAFPGLPGPILGLIELNENFGRLSASGIDVDLQLRSPRSRYGRFAVQLSGSYLGDWSVAFDGVHQQHVAGTFFFGSSLPRWQHTLTLGWDGGPWQATLLQVWRSGYVDARPGVDGEPRRVAPYRVWDWQIAYGAEAGLRLAIGVKNVFNSDPPFSNQRATFQLGYDPNYADPRGRAWYVRLAYRWR